MFRKRRLSAALANKVQQLRHAEYAHHAADGPAFPSIELQLIHDFIDVAERLRESARPEPVDQTNWTSILTFPWILPRPVKSKKRRRAGRVGRGETRDATPRWGRDLDQAFGGEPLARFTLAAPLVRSQLPADEEPNRCGDGRGIRRRVFRPGRISMHITCNGQL